MGAGSAMGGTVAGVVKAGAAMRIEDAEVRERGLQLAARLG